MSYETLTYEGYAAGSDASDNGVATFTDRLLAHGYAVVGVSVRGTGCSQAIGCTWMCSRTSRLRRT